VPRCTTFTAMAVGSWHAREPMFSGLRAPVPRCTTIFLRQHIYTVQMCITYICCGGKIVVIVVRGTGLYHDAVGSWHAREPMFSGLRTPVPRCTTTCRQTSKNCLQRHRAGTNHCAQTGARTRRPMMLKLRASACFRKDIGWRGKGYPRRPAAVAHSVVCHRVCNVTS
jgi:hypothetical protein